MRKAKRYCLRAALGFVLFCCVGCEYLNPRGLGYGARYESGDADRAPGILQSGSGAPDDDVSSWWFPLYLLLQIGGSYLAR